MIFGARILKDLAKFPKTHQNLKSLKFRIFEILEIVGLLENLEI